MQNDGAIFVLTKCKYWCGECVEQIFPGPRTEQSWQPWREYPLG